MPDFSHYNIQYTDHDGETSTVRVRCDKISGVAVDYDAMLVEFVDLQDGIAGITLGDKQKSERVQGNTVASSQPADENAQRERKWLVQYHDPVSFKKYTLELPCADLAQLNPTNRKHAFMGDGGVVDAFVDALEAYGLTPDGGGIEVDQITHVGRNV